MDFHTAEPEQVLSELGTTREGLDDGEAHARLAKYGANVISGKHRRSALDILLAQFGNGVLVLLVAAAAISFYLGHVIDAIGISAAVVLSILFGFALEYKADESLRALQALQNPKAVVTRNGRNKVVSASELVPGDIIRLDEGEKIAADCRILSSTGLEINEAALTGESLAVEKGSKGVSRDARLAERKCMVYAGTFVVKGHGLAVVVATGDKTELGMIATTLSGIESEKTALYTSLDDLGKKVSIVSIIVIAMLILVGLYEGRNLAGLFVLGVSLAVAAVPEGLLTVLTIILAVSVKRMADHSALVKRLNAVEALGSASVIVMDKTGTITTGKMTLSWIYHAGNTYPAKSAPSGCLSLELASYCNSATITDKGLSGDEMDKAILEAAKDCGLDIRAIKKAESIAFYPLDSARKRMAAVFKIGGEQVAIVKGAPEIVLSLCDRVETGEGITGLDAKCRKDIENSLNVMASEGMRVLAVAYKKGGRTGLKEVEKKLVFSGLLAFSDPAREGVPEMIAAAKAAGIKVLMLTGDNRVTAISIGKAVGLITGEKEAVEWGEIESLPVDKLEARLMEVGVIARATPLSKLRVVEAFTAMGENVVVTGDGVNDAPALKRAQVGVVMGSGTDVSKEAGNLVLLDDNIATLIVAIRYGRTVFDNIVNFIRFQFTTNIALLILFFTSFFGGLPYLLTPVQILFVNIVMDGPPALALGFEEAVGDVLKEKVKKKRAVLSRNTIRSIAISALFMVIVTLGVFFYYNAARPALAPTAAFLVFVLLQLFNSMNCRFAREPFYENAKSNPYIWAALAALFLLMIPIIQTPWLGTAFATAPLAMADWLLITAAAATVLILEEVKKRLLPSWTEY